MDLDQPDLGSNPWVAFRKTASEPNPVHYSFAGHVSVRDGSEQRVGGLEPEITFLLHQQSFLCGLGTLMSLTGQLWK